MVFLLNLRLVNVSLLNYSTERTARTEEWKPSTIVGWTGIRCSVSYEHVLPLCMLIQNCFSWSSNDFNVSTSNVALELQNAGPMLPNRVGQTPWIVQISFGDGSVHEFFLLCSIHDMQPVTGHTCVNINTSNSWLLSAMNWTSSSL